MGKVYGGALALPGRHHIPYNTYERFYGAYAQLVSSSGNLA